MSAQRFFCSAASRENGESIFGTVARIDSWLLIEYPAAWPEVIEQTGLSVSGTHRQLLIRQSHALSTERIRCFYAATREFGSQIIGFDIESYDELGRIDLSAVAQRNAEHGSGEPLFLACTHGKHDKCCARHGRPLYAALHNHFGDRAWQSSHLGGDRFAGNLVFLPHGVYYGRVDPLEAPELAEAFARGELSLDHYRGRSCYGRAAQAADYFLRRETGIRRIDAFRLLESKRLNGAHWRVRFAGTGSREVYDVEFSTSEDLRQRLTCHSDAESPIRQYRLIRVIRALSGDEGNGRR
jgi:hypothetical protein